MTMSYRYHLSRRGLDPTMNRLNIQQGFSLSDKFSADSIVNESSQHSMDGFLASVERRAYVIAFASCRDQQIALDIVQDSMFRMVKNYSSKPSGQWQPLFFKVLNNRITDQHRKRGFGRMARWFGNNSVENEQATEAVDQLATEEIGPENLAISTDMKSAMELALTQLSIKQQQALMLRLWQGLSVREAAIAMGVSEGSVKTHLSRAVHEMREHLQEFKPK